MDRTKHLLPARHFLLALSVLLCPLMAEAAEPFVPGTGVKVDRLGDDFEDTNWGYTMNGSKASHEQDKKQRAPGGFSHNKRWYESALRGQPDVVQRIATPPGGMAGSKGSLLMATRLSGIPGKLAQEQMQDDLIMGVQTRLGRPIHVSWQPSATVRVFLPEFDRWENRTGASFGFRGDVRGTNADGEMEPYWPGFFILFRSETDRRFKEDFAQLSVRARKNGRDVPGPKIYEHGWWTLGMSYTPDGQVHYYAREGTGDLTEDDHLYSSFPYNSKAKYLDSVFFNVANWENGKNWSTPWVIDDPQVFVIPPKGQTVANLQRRGDGNSQTARRRTGLQSFFDKFR